MATWVNLARNVAAWVANFFLLKEDGFYLLLETGDKIILDAFNNGKHDAVWAGLSPHSSSWTNINKH